jgi:hypothetical protein
MGITFGSSIQISASSPVLVLAVRPGTGPLMLSFGRAEIGRFLAVFVGTIVWGRPPTGSRESARDALLFRADVLFHSLAP